MTQQNGSKDKVLTTTVETLVDSTGGVATLRE
jgi:hypothetical protein